MPNNCLLCGNKLNSDNECLECLSNIDEDLEIWKNESEDKKEIWDSIDNALNDAEDYGEIDPDGLEYDH